MNFVFTKTTPADKELYSTCLNNQEFIEMLYDGGHVNIEKYIQESPGDYKFVGHIKDNETYKPMGFAHFYNKKNNRYSYIGGIAPEFFNTGVGLYVSVAILSVFFSISPEAIITTGIYKFNKRSLKVDMAIGFTVGNETTEQWLLSLDKNKFQNAFTEKISQRITYSYIE